MSVIELDDIVRVVNKGDEPLTIGWDNRLYRLTPGKDAFVPAAAAFLWFGDPRSGSTVQSTRDTRGIVGFIPDRETEVRRLKVKWGDEPAQPEGVVANAPSVELYTLEGDKVTTVLDDPSGETTTPAEVVVSDHRALLGLVQKQQEQINRLLGALGVEGQPILTQDDVPAIQQVLAEEQAERESIETGEDAISAGSESEIPEDVDPNVPPGTSDPSQTTDLSGGIPAPSNGDWGTTPSS